MEEIFKSINWNVVLWGIILLVFAYTVNNLKHVGLPRDEPTNDVKTSQIPQRSFSQITGIDLWSVLSFMAILASIFILLPEFFPAFWYKVRNSEVFWPLLILIMYSAYMWKSRYEGYWGFFFFVLLGLVLYKFGNIRF